MKNITIAGNVGRDAENRTTPGGNHVTNWPVAVEERNGQEKRTVWFDCQMWGDRGAKLAQYITKGSRIAVTGELSTREHNGKTYLTVRADNVSLMGGGQDNQSSTARAADRAQRPASQGNALDDDIPFAPEWRG